MTPSNSSFPCSIVLKLPERVIRDYCGNSFHPDLISSALGGSLDLHPIGIHSSPLRARRTDTRILPYKVVHVYVTDPVPPGY